MKQHRKKETKTMPETMSFLVPPEADGERLDKWLSGQDSLGLTRSSLQNRMEHGDVIR